MDTPATDSRSVTQRFSGLSDDEQAVLDQADRFARQELHPLARRMDDEEWWPPEAFAKIGATGYFGIPVPDATTAMGFIIVIALSIVGGFLLNLTPCVLPVIPIKIMTISAHSSGVPKRPSGVGY